MAVAIGYAVYQVGSALSSGRKERKEASRRAKEYYAGVVEEHRRLKKEQRGVEALTRARLAASGAMANEGTAGLVQEEQKYEHKRQRDWMLAAGRAQARAIREGGRDAWSESVMSALGSAVSGWGEYSNIAKNP